MWEIVFLCNNKRSCWAFFTDLTAPQAPQITEHKTKDIPHICYMFTM